MLDPLSTPARSLICCLIARLETRAERVERQAKMLREMAAVVMGVARAEEQFALARAAQAMNDAQFGVKPDTGVRIASVDPGLAIARISRALRLTLAMENRLYDELETGPGVAPKVSAEPRPEPSPEQQRRIDLGVRGVINSSTIIPIVEQAIEAEEDPKGDGGDTEARIDHLYERLADEVEIVRFGALSIGENVARLCREIGLKPDWELWKDEEWAIEEAEAETPGSPYGRPWREDEAAETEEAAELAETADPPTPRLRRASP